MPRRKSLRSQLYRGARDLGNLDAAEKGPASLGKRYLRRAGSARPTAGLGVSVLLALALAGCGSSTVKPASLPTPAPFAAPTAGPTTTVAPTTTTTLPTFPASVQSAYLTACEGKGAAAPYCQCTLTWWEANRTVAQLNIGAQSDISASIAACTSPVAISVSATGTGPALVEVVNGSGVSTHNGALPYSTSVTADPLNVQVIVEDLSDTNGATVHCRLTIPGYPTIMSSGSGPISSATCAG